MDIPFTIDDFLGVFKTYNRAIQPAQLVAYVLGFAAWGFAIRGGRRASTVVLTVLAAFWAWTGAVYHVLFFSTINVAAYAFGALFILQAGLLLYAVFRTPPLDFRFAPTVSHVAGSVFIVYAMGVYPVLNYVFDHTYPGMPVFGVTPCPTTIFTFGVLLYSKNRVPPYLIVAPALWSLVGTSAAVNLRIFEDYGLVLAGIVGTTMLLAAKEGKHGEYGSNR
jgi:hypothetical protein